MVKKIMVAGVMLLVLSLGIQSISLSQEMTPSIVGQWQSEAIEDLGNGAFGWREFTISEKEWEIVFTLYFDKEKTMPVFTFRAVGPYEIQGKSGNVEGAYNAIFRFAKKYVTLKTDNQEVIANFGFSACNLEKDQEKDISEAGCSFLVSVDTCAQEYDLVKIDGDTLSLGARPADGNMCTEDRRPTALGYPLVKQ